MSDILNDQPRSVSEQVLRRINPALLPPHADLIVRINFNLIPLTAHAIKELVPAFHLNKTLVDIGLGQDDQLLLSIFHPKCAEPINILVKGDDLKTISITSGDGSDNSYVLNYQEQYVGQPLDVTLPATLADHYPGYQETDPEAQVALLAGRDVAQ